MTVIALKLPDEVARQLDIGNEAFRDVPTLVLAIDGLDVAASITTLANLHGQLHQFARALRSWVTRRPRGSEPARLLIKGNGISIELVLPPNVGVTQIIEALNELFATAPNEPRSSRLRRGGLRSWQG